MTMEPLLSVQLLDALGRLQADVHQAAAVLGFGGQQALTAWEQMIQRKLLPRLRPDFPLIAAVCGGGSSGKSTLFNSLVGERISPTGGRAGINRRVLIGVHPSHLAQPNFLEALFDPFGSPPQPLKQSGELTMDGAPLYYPSQWLPPNLVLLDTPDFDTGARGVYTNRELARQSLETADILIYIFTNANYNNRDNTDFLSQMLTGIGRRKTFLVYRVYPSFSDDEVRNHALTVARNLYGQESETSVLGLFRADDENAVAAGEKSISLRAAGPPHLTFAQALARIDPRSLRLSLFTSILTDVVAGADRFLKQIQHSAAQLTLYRDAIQAAQSLCVQEALSHFPMDRVMKRFSEIWLATDPTHIRIMRKTGRIVETPLRAVLTAVRWFKKKEDGRPPQAKDFQSELEVDLLGAANQLYKSLVDPEVTVTLAGHDPVARRMLSTIQGLEADGPPQDLPLASARPAGASGSFTFQVGAHPVVAEQQQALRQRNWRLALDQIVSSKQAILSLSGPMEAELAALADHFRRQMGWGARIQQTFTAFLNVLPATAAVTYILATGDPVGAVGIKVKLAGLFGLKDLYALVAIPVTAGLKQADLNQLQAMLGPIAQTWLNEKLKTVQALFEREISAGMLGAAEQQLTLVQGLTGRIESQLAICAGALGA
jgi:hypothetical protein